MYKSIQISDTGEIIHIDTETAGKTLINMGIDSRQQLRIVTLNRDEAIDIANALLDAANEKQAASQQTGARE